MLFKKSICPVCNQEIKNKFKIADATICMNCAALNANGKNDTTVSIRTRYLENLERQRIFQESRKFNDIFSDVISIDDTNTLFYIENKKLSSQRIFKFDEIIGYEKHSPNNTTIVNKDGNKTVSPLKNSISFLLVKINTTIGIVDLVTTKPPIKFENFLNSCLVNKTTTASEAPVNVADELLKFKQLLDAGAITQEEFDIQKQKLLNR